MNNIFLGFLFILVAAVAGGCFGLQYRIMRKYTVEYASLLSMFFATIVVPLIVVSFVFPGWTEAMARAGWTTNLLVFGFGFAWGLGAITYAYGSNILGMALAAAIIKGITIAVGSGIPLVRRRNDIAATDGGMDPRIVIIAGILLLLAGTWFAGRAGILREKETGTENEEAPRDPTVAGGFIFGMFMCLVSGVLSASINLGYDWSQPLEDEMIRIVHEQNLAEEQESTDEQKSTDAPNSTDEQHPTNEPKPAAEDGTVPADGKDPLNGLATLIRWMPAYLGGISALLIFMGGAMIKNGNWRNYFAVGSLRDCLIACSMGGVHFLAPIPYGIGAYYLNLAGQADLGTTIGWGINIGLALVVAAAIGFMTGEWKNASGRSRSSIFISIVVILLAIVVLAYGNSLA